MPSSEQLRRNQERARRAFAVAKGSALTYGEVPLEEIAVRHGRVEREDGKGGFMTLRTITFLLPLGAIGEGVEPKSSDKVTCDGKVYSVFEVITNTDHHLVRAGIHKRS